jgi:hypothetical protein
MRLIMGEKTKIITYSPDGRPREIVGELMDYELETGTFNGLFYDSIDNVSLIYSETNEDIDYIITFNDLYSKWKQETFLDSSSKIFDNINYQKIIALGKNILPILINNLDGSSTFLFFALYKITNENPVQLENYGNILAMTEDWKNWWEANKKNYA